MSGRVKRVSAVLLAAVTALGILALQHVMVRPDPQAIAEEALIFNADDAQWFGEEPAFAQSISLRRIINERGERLAELVVDAQERLVGAGQLLLPPCLRLAEVLEGAVLLNNCGAYRLLSVSAEHFQYRAASLRSVFIAPLSGSLDLRDNAAASALLAEYRRRLYSAPLSLRGAVQLERRKVADGSRQYFIYPGSDSRLFSLLPLRAGDRLHAVNGVSLAAAEALTELYEHLDSAVDLTVTLERDGGEIIVVMLSLPESDGVAASLAAE